MSLAQTQDLRAEALQVAAAEPARHGWTVEAVLALFELPFNDLLHRAQTVHREHFDANAVQLVDAAVDQDRRLSRGLRLLPAVGALRHRRRSRASCCRSTQVLDAARRAKAAGATRFCMGAAWRGPKDRDIETVLEMVRA